MNNTNYLYVNNLSKQFGDFTALSQISLDIKKGEFICFLGPSGCGKTTLLRTIAGLELPSEGQIIQATKDITLLPPEKRDFGIVFQSYALFPNLTVMENIAFGLINQGVNKQDATVKVQEWLKLVDLPDSENKYPSQLSGGQQQRVALARALALSPGLLLLDEPLSALDAKVRAHLRHEICQLQKKLGVTTIMVTHDQEEALTMADRIVVMNHGVIEQIGTPREIYHQPSSKFVADFIGSMNFMRAECHSEHQLSVEGYTFPATQTVNHPHVEVALRPEQIQISNELENGITAKIANQEFLGSFVRLECEVEHTDNLIQVNVSSEQLKNQTLEIGDLCSLSWKAEDALIFEEQHV
ncbi:phosphonate ABC transporter ATP-binding protein [Vibrio sp. 10N.286.49.B3]|uniref:putative 2-aminoethylphosphonate ABC transporter ATP-binding protein n=1 Tax=Vibrio sp. 10N.286.49.B3 TaxID=1880855 RepID=UPI000C84682D|nr:putative 2-aminoethylphosphonate ABC transporter ATP-binding protein [Vibrio sp. 10N.286.49.B3]PMH46144.1 phosphonate ABC transporter ATP-binding protein [Vibrio sp. 10N.286.49.B3]